MKLFRLMGTMTIVAAVAATMAVSASALSASYDDGTVAISGVTAQENGDYTVMVTTAIESEVPGESDIFQINQTEAAPTSAVVGDLEDGAYYVRVGGYSTGFENARFAVSPEAATATKTVVEATGAADAQAEYYSIAIAEAPTNLIPYWNADVKVGDAAAVNKSIPVANWASIAGNVSVYLIYQDDSTEGTTLDNVKLIWK